MITPTRFQIVTCLLVAGITASATHARVVGRLHTMFQATVKIEVTGGPIIYIDPVNIETTPADADFILLTHSHPDHHSIPVMTRLRKPGTVFVSSPPGVPGLMTNFPGATIHAVTPGTKLTLGSVEVETVPMYNIIKFNNHPRAMNFVGYVINVGGVRVYHAGDTERIPEMKQFSADVVMLPMGQTFTMTSVQDAVAAAIDLKPRIAIPIHFGNAEGTSADADYFVSQLSSRMQTLKNTPPEGFALEVSETVSIAQQPASQTVAPGGRASLGVVATGAGTMRYQWRRNGEQLAGATAATLEIPQAGAADEADYEVIVSDANGPVRSRMARLTVAVPQTGRLVNLSLRATAQGGGRALIVGAAVVGGSKQVLVRGIGPTLAAFGVGGALPNPHLEVHGMVNGRDTILASNDNWASGDAATTSALRAAFFNAGAFGLGNSAGLDAAVVTTFEGARTVHLSDTANRTGVALVELYDLQPAGAARLTNLSARSFAGTGEDTLTVGFAISGNTPQRLLIRAVGPQLSAGFGVPNALMDPKLTLFIVDSGRHALFAANDNWAEGGAAPVRAAFAAAGAFDFPDAASRDAALAITVPAGVYTAQVSGAGNSTGEVLLEIYELP